MLLSVCSVILLSCLLNPESWWSRYSPQLWMLPILIGATCKRHQLLLGICLALALNSLAILFVNTRGAYLNSSDVKNTLNKLAPYKNSTLPGSVEDYYANKLRLSELNIRLTPPEGCSNKVYFAGSTSFVCLP